MDKYVVDASVVAKWFLQDEELVAVAQEILTRMLASEIELHAPSLLQYEFGHILTKAVRRNRRPIDSKTSLRAYTTFCKYPLVFHNLDIPKRLKALEFANKFYRSFYDAAYINLAMLLDCQWLTCEQRYKDSLPPDFPTNYVLMLESFS